MKELLKNSKAFKAVIGVLYFSVIIAAVVFDIHLLKSSDSPFDNNPSQSNEDAYADAPDDAFVPSEATVIVTGDILPHSPLRKAYYDGESYNFDSIFTYISSYVKEADFAVANLETTLAGDKDGYEYSGYPQFNCPDEIVDSLKNAGFDMLLTANNHSSDTSAHGILRTQEIVRSKGLLNLGTRLDSSEKRYKIQNINGIDIGMICYTYSQIDSSTGKISLNGIPVSSEVTDCINAFDETKLSLFYEQMEQNIAAMKADGAKAIVMFIHWGVEYQLKQNSIQTEIAQKMCDFGVDVIVGGHPHVVQPAELLVSSVDPEHVTLCVYSVGNGVSNQRAQYMNLNTGHTEDGMLFSFTFKTDKNGSVSLSDAEIIPTWVYLNSGKYYIIPLDKNVSDWKSSFNMGSNGEADAKKSYERTNKLVSEGMNEAAAYMLNGTKPITEAAAVG